MMRPIAMFVLMVSFVGVTGGIAAPRPTTVKGVFEKMDGSKFIVQVTPRGGASEDVPIMTDADTKVTIEGKPGKLAALKKDQKVVVTVMDGKATAIVVEPVKRGRAPAAPWLLRGTIVKVDGSKLIVKVTQQGGDDKDVTVTTDQDTTVTIEGKPGKFADLKPGQVVVVNPPRGIASHIIVPPSSDK
jgi:hypothetical protein